MEYHFIANGRLLSKLLAKYKNTFLAFCELINNSIQAKASKIKIYIIQNPSDKLTKTMVEEIKIWDSGVGVSKFEFKKKILEICTDVKPRGEGIGRFSAFQLGSCIEIETVAFDQKVNKYTKTVLPINIEVFESSELEEVKLYANHEELEGDYKPYYQVTISKFYDEQITKKESSKRLHRNLLIENIEEALFTQYPLEILNDQISFYINDKKVDSSCYIIGEPEKNTREYIDLEGDRHTIELLFINFKSVSSKIKVFFRIENNGVKNIVYDFDYECNIPDTNSFLVYIDSELFSNNIDIFRNFLISKMDEDVKHLIENIKSYIDEFFKEKYKEYFDFSQNLRKDNFYPYKERKSSSNTKEVVFEHIAYYIEKEHKILKAKSALRKVIYPLVDKAINNGELDLILSQIISLKDEYVDKFKELLERADLEEVIQFSENVAKKTQFLDFLHNLVYGEPSKYIKERSQLHKIIEKNLWIFGEQYNNTPFFHSDKNLCNSLLDLRNKMFNCEPNKEDENLIELPDDKLKDIIDLFFFNEKITDDGKTEVMTVELKAPKCRISHKELEQVDRYKFDIEKKGVFSTDISYKIILISSELTEFAKSSIGTIDQKNPFLYKRSNTKNIEIWVIKWSDLIYSNKRKLSYLGNQLKTKDQNTIEVLEKEYADIEFSELSSLLHSTHSSSR